MKPVSIPPAELPSGERVLLYVYRYCQNRPFPPTQRGISKALGLRGKSAVPHQLNRLRKLGWVKWKSGTACTLTLTPAGAAQAMRLDYATRAQP
jgi:SOS-response transcriptional repressor LexA